MEQQPKVNSNDKDDPNKSSDQNTKQDEQDVAVNANASPSFSSSASLNDTLQNAQSNETLKSNCESVTQTSSESQPKCDCSQSEIINSTPTEIFDTRDTAKSSAPVPNEDTKETFTKNKTSNKVTTTQIPPIQIILSPTSSGPLFRMRQPFKILCDIWGVLTSYNFKSELSKYIDDHLKEFLLTHMDNEEIQEYVVDLANKTSEQLTKWPDMPEVAKPIMKLDKETVVNSAVANLLYRRNHKDKSLILPFMRIFNHIWNQGYKNKTLKTHVFPDVLPNFSKWHYQPLFIKIYTFATGSDEEQKQFLGSSKEGDLSDFVVTGFNSRGQHKRDSYRFKQIVSILAERNAENLFYLTDNPVKAEMAKKAGLTVFIVCREGNKQYKQEDLDKFTIINSFDQFDFWPFH